MLTTDVSAKSRLLYLLIAHTARPSLRVLLFVHCYLARIYNYKYISRDVAHWLGAQWIIASLVLCDTPAACILPVLRCLHNK